MKHDDKKDLPPELPPAPPKQPRVTYGFSCGAGPCKTFRIIDGVSRRLEPPELPAPARIVTGRRR